MHKNNANRTHDHVSGIRLYVWGDTWPSVRVDPDLENTTRNIMHKQYPRERAHVRNQSKIWICNGGIHGMESSRTGEGAAELGVSCEGRRRVATVEFTHTHEISLIYHRLSRPTLLSSYSNQNVDACQTQFPGNRFRTPDTSSEGCVSLRSSVEGLRSGRSGEHHGSTRTKCSKYAAVVEAR